MCTCVKEKKLQNKSHGRMNSCLKIFSFLSWYTQLMLENLSTCCSGENEVISPKQSPLIQPITAIALMRMVGNPEQQIQLLKVTFQTLLCLMQLTYHHTLIRQSCLVRPTCPVKSCFFFLDLLLYCTFWRVCHCSFSSIKPFPSFFF